MTQITAAMVKELREQTGAGMMDVKRALTEADGNVEEATKILRKKGLAAATKKAGRVTSEGLVQAYTTARVGVLVEVNSETDFVARTEQFRQFAEEIARLIARSKAATVEALSHEAWNGETVGEKTQSMIASLRENITLRRFARFEAAPNAAIASYVHAGGKIGVMVELGATSGSGSVRMNEIARDVAMHIAASDPRFVHRDEVTQKDIDTEREIAREQALKEGKPPNILDKIVTGKLEKFYGVTCLLEQPYIRNDKQNVGEYLQSVGKDAGCAYAVTRFVRYKLGEGIEKKADDFAAEVMSYVK